MKTPARLLLTLIFTALILTACVKPTPTPNLNATATYGAEQLHAQLTAQAIRGVTP